MGKKLQQVTDAIHGTIYLSDMESELISTPYFFRLHDVYQSSTVYMTFPSNRTKRYEHSLGTMELASLMFFSAISNADSPTRNGFFDDLKKEFMKLLQKICAQTESQTAPYFISSKEQIIASFGNKIKVSQVDNKFLQGSVCNWLRQGIGAQCLADSALDNFQFYPADMEGEQAESDILPLFLYRCMLQALRIVALFHDVGHPPYSHIIETILGSLYEACKSSKNEFDNSKVKGFLDVMDSYVSSKKNGCRYQMILTNNKCNEQEQLHEKIGMSLLQSAINEVTPDLIKETAELEASEHKITKILYYITVVEFAMAIRAEKTTLFKSVHKLVDGIMDSDRLDYIMRDSLNSGVNWGEIPYKRLINSAKMFKKVGEGNKKYYVIAFPQKVSDDITDLLLVRYKIYARINFHHRCMKTAVSLQSAVYELAKDYLRHKNDEDCICPRIKNLWMALELGLRQGKRTNQVIQWNDSWLISVLHEALVKLSDEDTTEGDILFLKENLEEILLNRKRFYSLIKRGIDSAYLIRKAFDCAEVTEEKINDLYTMESKKYYENGGEQPLLSEVINDPGAKALDSIRRLNLLKKAMKSGDMEFLDTLMPMSADSLENKFDKILKDLKKSQEVADYKIIVNKLRSKTGLPTGQDALDAIYVYSGKEDCEKFDDEILHSQIEAIEKSVPWVYVYFVPVKDHERDVGKVSRIVFDELAKEIGNELKCRYDELFSRK